MPTTRLASLRRDDSAQPAVSLTLLWDVLSGPGLPGRTAGAERASWPASLQRLVDHHAELVERRRLVPLQRVEGRVRAALGRRRKS